MSMFISSYMKSDKSPSVLYLKKRPQSPTPPKLKKTVSFQKARPSKTMARIPFAIVDAFCVPDQPFTGNQAAICVLQSDVSSLEQYLT